MTNSDAAAKAQAKAEQDLMALLRIRAGNDQHQLTRRTKKAVASIRKAADHYRRHVKPHIPRNHKLDRGGIADTRIQLRALKQALGDVNATVKALGPQAIRLLRGRLGTDEDPGPKGKLVRSLNTPELMALSRRLEGAIQQADSAPNRKSDVAIIHLACAVGRELRELGIPLAASETGELITGKRGGGTWAHAIELSLKMAGFGEGRKVRKRTLSQAKVWLDEHDGAFS